MLGLGAGRDLKHGVCTQRTNIDSLHHSRGVHPQWEGSARRNPRPSHAAARLAGFVARERRVIEELSQRAPKGTGGCGEDE